MSSDSVSAAPLREKLAEFEMCSVLRDKHLRSLPSSSFSSLTFADSAWPLLGRADADTQPEFQTSAAILYERTRAA